MDIDTALKYMTIEKAIELEQRRFFCNADETINAIAIHCMKKQIPLNIGETYQARIEDMPGKCVLSGNCPVCGSPVPKKHWYCWSCGQRLKWPENRQFSWERDRMDLKEILKTHVNSALISIQNHDRDNGFFRDTVVEVENDLKSRGYEPLGICKNVPFECSSASQSVAFVYRYDEEIYWCHMPEIYWHHLLVDCYGRAEAGMIFEEFLDS